MPFCRPHPDEEYPRLKPSLLSCLASLSVLQLSRAPSPGQSSEGLSRLLPQPAPSAVGRHRKEGCKAPMPRLLLDQSRISLGVRGIFIIGWVFTHFVSPLSLQVAAKSRNRPEDRKPWENEVKGGLRLDVSKTPGLFAHGPSPTLLARGRDLAKAMPASTDKRLSRTQPTRSPRKPPSSAQPPSLK